MRDLAVLFLHLLATVVRLDGPGSARDVVAEAVFVKQQLLILNRSRDIPHFRLVSRVVASVCTLLMRPTRLVRAAAVLKPSSALTIGNSPPTGNLTEHAIVIQNVIREESHQYFDP
jgi:hypothetical protein